MEMVVSYFGMMAAAFGVGTIGGAIVAEGEVRNFEKRG
jgi:hypothetical protein